MNARWTTSVMMLTTVFTTSTGTAYTGHRVCLVGSVKQGILTDKANFSGKGCSYISRYNSIFTDFMVSPAGYKMHHAKDIEITCRTGFNVNISFYLRAKKSQTYCQVQLCYPVTCLLRLALPYLVFYLMDFMCCRYMHKEMLARYDAERETWPDLGPVEPYDNFNETERDGCDLGDDFHR